ncbi:MAG: hypothetical protein AAFO07_04200 [Bacteroidota bacterium]
MKGILFTEILFRATIFGLKKETRRVIKGISNDWVLKDSTWNPDIGSFQFESPSGEKKNIKPRYKPGDIVYLKEPFFYDNGIVRYKFGTPHAAMKFKNKLFMPAKAARYFIRIEEVYPHLVREIPFKSAVDEWCIDIYPCSHLNTWDRYKHSFLKVWDNVNEEEYQSKFNPWCFAYKYKLLSENSFDKVEYVYL